MKEILKSIFQDLKSWKQIKINRWHLHFIVAAPVGVILGYLSNMLNFPNNLEQIGEYFIPIFAMVFGCFGFEMIQQGNRIIEAKERFESNKDAWVGIITGAIFIIITKLIIY